MKYYYLKLHALALVEVEAGAGESEYWRPLRPRPGPLKPLFGEAFEKYDGETQPPAKLNTQCGASFKCY